MNKKKKAFTLTELLVVVVVIGVLSAVVLPKFSKVIETRRTTEAEELMGAIRTEQEKRCALDKEYATDFNGLSDIVKSDNTKNYTLTLASTGVNASRKDKYNYTLSIPSYADGRICCSGNDCDKLNKNYPKCDNFTPEASPVACAGEVTTPEPPSYECTGNATQACGCQNKGTQSRTCNTATGVWSDWGACSVSEACECTGAKPEESQTCNTCGTQTRSVTCDSATGEWKTGSWSACDKTAAECTECPEGKIYDAASGKCVCDTDSMAYILCHEEQECEDGSFAMPTWDEDTCSCESSCPPLAETPHTLVCTRVSYQDAMNGFMVGPDGQLPLSVAEARQACELYGQSVVAYEAIAPTSNCSDPHKPCTTTPGWGKKWTCQEGEVECGVRGIGHCDPCTCICGVG